MIDKMGKYFKDMKQDMKRVSCHLQGAQDLLVKYGYQIDFINIRNIETNDIIEKRLEK